MEITQIKEKLCILAVALHLQYLPYGELFVSQRNYSFALNTSLDVFNPHWEMICNKTSKPRWAKGFTLFERAIASEFVNPKR